MTRRLAPDGVSGQFFRCGSGLEQAVVWVARGFAVLAAVGFVGAVAVATLAPQTLSGSEALALADPQLPFTVQSWVIGHLGAWVWHHLAAPVLVRPVWLVPASLFLVASGVAATAAAPSGGARRRQRRS